MTCMKEKQAKSVEIIPFTIQFSRLERAYKHQSSDASFSLHPRCRSNINTISVLDFVIFINMVLICDIKLQQQLLLF